MLLVVLFELLPGLIVFRVLLIGLVLRLPQGCMLPLESGELRPDVRELLGKAVRTLTRIAYRILLHLLLLQLASQPLVLLPQPCHLLERVLKRVERRLAQLHMAHELRLQRLYVTRKLLHRVLAQLFELALLLFRASVGLSGE